MLSNLNTVNPAETIKCLGGKSGLKWTVCRLWISNASGVGHILKTDVGLGIILYTFHKKRSVYAFEVVIHTSLPWKLLFAFWFLSFGLLNKSQANFRLSYLWNVSDSKAMKRLRQRTADKASQSPTKIFAMIGSTFNMFYERKNSTHQIEIILYNQSSVSFPHYFSHCFLYPIPYFSLIFSLSLSFSLIHK